MVEMQPKSHLLPDLALHSPFVSFNSASISDCNTSRSVLRSSIDFAGLCFGSAVRDLTPTEVAGQGPGYISKNGEGMKPEKMCSDAAIRA
jgi:hypothetical protein